MKTWSLIDESGKAIRKNEPNQWAILISCQKADGAHFKKAESAEVESGTIVYKIGVAETEVVKVASRGEEGYEQFHYNRYKRNTPCIRKFTLVSEEK